MPGVQNNKSITIAILNRKENHSHIITSHLLRFICAQIHIQKSARIISTMERAFVEIMIHYHMLLKYFRHNISIHFTLTYAI